MSAFTNLRKSAQDELDRLATDAKKVASGGFTRDERYWQPVKDPHGNGSAVIRFLPTPNGEKFPYVKKFSYGFKGPSGRWFIENSPATIDQPCPVNERWSKLWNEGTEEARERAKLFKRRVSFISNIVVLKHTARPTDEGKVFLYEYGKKIYDMLNEKMNPSFADVQRFNPFDLWEGANFRLRVMKVAGFPNYDKSEFDAPGPLAEDAAMEKIWNSQYSLAAEVASNKFKPYDELRTKLDSVMGGGSPRLLTEDPLPETGPTEMPQHAAPAGDAEGEDSIEWFAKLAAKK